MAIVRRDRLIEIGRSHLNTVCDFADAVTGGDDDDDRDNDDSKDIFHQIMSQSHD